MNSTPTTGSVLGSRYVLDHLIAVGGMGQVWKATDQVLERPVAVKMLRTDLLDSDDFRNRLRAEARLAAGLPHPGTAHVYDYAEDSFDGRRVAFLVMEFVEGQPLSHRLARGDRPKLGEVVSILDQAARALGAAHSVGIVHRDVKPGNLLITPDGRVKVTDFGIARAMNSSDITEVGKVIGTVRYMSPEQARGGDATPASDVYSLAVIGYEMLSGSTPFHGDTPDAIAWAHVHASPPALPMHVPAELRSLIEQSLAKLPDERPGDGARFAGALQRVTIDPTLPIVASTTRFDPTSRPPTQNVGVDPTAVFHHPVTTVERLTTAEDAGAETASPVRSPSEEPLIVGGLVHQQRRRRRAAAWGAAMAVAVCLLVLMALSGGSDDGATIASGASDPPVTTSAPPAAAVNFVTVEPSTYLGHTEADARAALTAAGLTVVTKTAPSTGDLTGLVIDVQPNGPVAPGSTVTITLGDGTMAPATDPVTDDPVTHDPGTGRGNGYGKDKNKGRNRD